MGWTGAMGTEWKSDTSVVCKAAAGVEGSLTVQMSVGERGGSLSAGSTYDVGMVSGVAGWNTGATGGGSVSVSGAGFGMSR